MTGKEEWFVEIGDSTVSVAKKDEEFLIRENENNNVRIFYKFKPVFIRKDTNKDFQWRIRNLNYPKDNFKVELDKVQEEFSKSQLKNKFLEGFKSKCQEKIINEKEQIIEKIKQYNQKWMNWSENIEDKFDEYKRRLISELQIIQNNFTKILDKRKLERSEYNKLKQNIAEVESELKKTISDQIIALNEKDEQIKLLQSTGSGFLLTNKGEVKEFDTTEELNKLVTEKDRLIEETRKQQEEEITKLRQEKDEEAVKEKYKFYSYGDAMLII